MSDTVDLMDIRPRNQRYCELGPLLADELCLFAIALVDEVEVVATRRAFLIGNEQVATRCSTIR